MNSCRRVYERAVEFFGEDNVDQDLFAAFAKFEEKNREVGLVYLYTYYWCVKCEEYRGVGLV